MRKPGTTVCIRMILAITTLVVLLISCIPESVETGSIQLTPQYSLGTPPTIDSYTVTLTAPGINPVVLDNYTPGNTITIPVGIDMSIDLTGNVNSGSTSAALTFTGLGNAASLQVGITEQITLQMSVSSTRLVIPDEYNQRLVQVDSMAGENWATLTAGDISYGFQMNPTDVDYDALGRLLVSNSFQLTGTTNIFFINDITSTSYTAVVNESGVIALTVDRAANILYFVTTSALFSVDLSGTLPATPTVLNVAGLSFTGFQGIEYDGSGNLYLACGGNGAILYNIATESPVTQLAVGLDLRDMHFRDGVLHAANDYGPSGECILQLNSTSLAILDGFGDTTEDIISTQGYFFGAHKFIAQMNDGFIVTDESQNIDIDRIVGFDDLAGSGWTLYGVTGNGVGEFNLHETPF